MSFFIKNKTAVVFSIFFLMVFIFAGSVSAALTFTKIGDQGLSGDRHNSYSWCMGILHHDDGDYLYVGSNRDIVYLVMAGLFKTIDPTADFDTIKGNIQTFFSGDVATYDQISDVDLRARIFRLKLGGTGTWELVYTAPTAVVQGQTIALEFGYRGMQVFTDTAGETALYVVTDAGFSKISRVLKISQTQDPAGPVVLKEVFRIQGATTLRPITVHDSKLYIGANNDIYEASNPEAQGDWTKIATDASFGGLIAGGRKAMLWQFASFNDFLYVTLAEDVDTTKAQTADNGGAWLFKGKYSTETAQWAWTPIVADQVSFPTAPYPKGLGNRFNTTLSLASFQDNLYVGTLMTFPSLIASGNLSLILQNRIPPQIYRFTKDDAGEMVIGDTIGTTKSSIFTTRQGNYGAGFFNRSNLQMLSLDETVRNANFSLNQYLWWMAEYKGKLYASTFDMRGFLKYMTKENLALIGMAGDDSTWQNIQSVLQAIDTYNDNPAGFDIYVTSDGNNWAPVTRDGFGDSFNYGGRILLASNDTEDTLYIGTANPFYGAQVYALEDDGVAAAAPPSAGGGGCFIASVAFGTPLAAQVEILRQFRDKYLLTNTLGRKFVDWYYLNGPVAASYIKDKPLAKAAVRAALYPLIGFSFLLISGYLPFVMLGIILSALLFFRFRQKKISDA